MAVRPQRLLRQPPSPGAFETDPFRAPGGFPDRFRDFTDCAGRTADLRWDPMPHYTARELVESGALTPRAFQECVQCLRDRRTVLVTGITGSGKTTLLRALAGLVPTDERMLVLDEGGDLSLEGAQRRHIAVRRADPAQSPRETVARALEVAPRVLVIDNICPPEAGAVLRALAAAAMPGVCSGWAPSRSMRRSPAWRAGACWTASLGRRPAAELPARSSSPSVSREPLSAFIACRR